MKAIVQDTFGSAEVLQLRDIAIPDPGHGQIRVAIKAAGCGPDVWHLMTGLPKLARIAPEFRRWFGDPRGRDFAGVVDALGPGVTGVTLGDEVLGVCGGSFAEYAVTEVDKVVPKPARLSFEQAAALPISGATALQALRDACGLTPGQTPPRRVVILGAGGGVGTLAVQIAKAYGAHVTAVASTSKRDLVIGLGADEFIDYTVDDFADGTRKWDAIVDMAGRRPLGVLSRALTPGGVAAIVGGDGGGAWTGGFLRGMLRGPIRSLVSKKTYRMVLAVERRDDFAELTHLVEVGALTPVVDRTFALPDAAAALRYLELGHPAGKVVVTTHEH